MFFLNLSAIHRSVININNVYGPSKRLLPTGRGGITSQEDMHGHVRYSIVELGLDGGGIVTVPCRTIWPSSDAVQNIVFNEVPVVVIDIMPPFSGGGGGYGDTSSSLSTPVPRRCTVFEHLPAAPLWPEADPGF